MQRRYLPIFILTGILFAAALVGYLIPADSADPPARVLMDNKGGKIILSHERHADTLAQNCARCHHTSGKSQTPLPCSDCHVKKFDENFLIDHQESFAKEQCAVCHHAPSTTAEMFSHDDHETDYAENDCQACHHDESIEPEPQSCSECHGKKATGSTPSLKDASHTRCADCHDDYFKEGIEGCASCHTREKAKKSEPQSCADCHTEPVDALIPTTTKAFHTQCMSCHEEQDKGPFGDDACYQCHMK